jgi:hypothetical protein
VLWIQPIGGLRGFQIEAQPLLNAKRAQLRRALGQVARPLESQ